MCQFRQKKSCIFAFLLTLLCFFKMAFAGSALSLNLAIESLASSAKLLASLVSSVAFSLSVGAFTSSIFAFAAVQF